MSRYKGRKKRTITFYHTSPRRFRNGDILTGGHSGGYGSSSHYVCLTDSPAVHRTVAHKAVPGDWIVYEVEPLYPVEYGSFNTELLTKAARVIRTVGRAVGLTKQMQKIPLYIPVGYTGRTNDDTPQKEEVAPRGSSVRARPRRGVKIGHRR